MGVTSPFGWQLDELWTALLEKRSGIRRVEAYDPQCFRSQVGGEMPKFTLGDFIPKSYRKSAKVMSRDIKLSMVSAYQAASDAGLKTKCLVDRGEVELPPNVDPARFGANIGAGLICADLTELARALSSAAGPDRQFSLVEWGQEGMSNLTPLWLLKFLPNMLACHVTIVHDAQAPSNTVTCGEASSHLAIGEAYHTIQRNAADVCICGGIESKLNCMSTLRQDLFGRLVREHEGDPASACRPFDAAHCGTVASEGGGLLILEALEHAQARQAKIYGEVVGFGAACNTRSWTEPEQDGRAIGMAISKGLRSAGLAADDIDLIGTFGTGVPQFDRAEASAIRNVFGESAGRIPALAIKGAVGNNGAGSGAIDLAVCLLSMKHNTVPAALSTTRMAPDCDFKLVIGDAIDARIDNFVSIAYALSGGQTAALVIKRFVE
jgi:3-oxoacyl-[acyl-carrier-protein] synthase II